MSIPDGDQTYAINIHNQQQRKNHMNTDFDLDNYDLSTSEGRSAMRVAVAQEPDDHVEAFYTLASTGLDALCAGQEEILAAARTVAAQIETVSAALIIFDETLQMREAAKANAQPAKAKKTHSPKSTIH